MYIVTWFAVVSAGSIIVPLDWQRKNSDLSELITDSKSSVVIYGDEITDFTENYIKSRRMLFSSDLVGFRRSSTETL